jgi:hypothetical protein
MKCADWFADTRAFVGVMRLNERLLKPLCNDRVNRVVVLFYSIDVKLCDLNRRQFALSHVGD